LNFATSDSSYAYSRLSLILLEKIATCIFQGEPVLLVGETGSGKTSKIQHLSRKFNQKLVVLNVSLKQKELALVIIRKLKIIFY